MVRGTTVGGLSARYCFSVSESMLADIFAVILKGELEQWVAVADQGKRWGKARVRVVAAGYSLTYLQLRRVSLTLHSIARSS